MFTHPFSRISRRTQLIAVSLAAVSVGVAGIAVNAAGGDATTTSATTNAKAAATSATASAAAPSTDAAQPAPAQHVTPSPASTDILVEGDSASVAPVTAASSGEAATTPASEASPEPIVESVEEPAEPAEPADEVDEPEPPGEPGVVEGDDDPVDPPPPPPVGGPTELASVPNDVPPLPPIPGPFDLTTLPPTPEPTIDDFVAPTDPTPFDIATDFQIAPLPGHLGTITSGLEGCQLDCVTSAILTSNALNANVQLAAETTVPVHFEVQVSEVGGNGSQYFNNPGHDTSWSTTLGPLQPNTTYDLNLIAIDQDGHSKMYDHQFTTVDIIDGFAGNAKGCALDCITEGVVDKTADFSTVGVHVETNSPASLRVWLSTAAPTWVDDPDAKPAFGPVFDAGTATSWNFDLSGLEAETTYHLVALAEDAYGEHYRVGSFTTDPDPDVNVLVTFEDITVSHDGDKHQLNRGEIRFAWGFEGIAVGNRSEEKMHATRFELHSHNSRWFSIDAESGQIPQLAATAGERDADGLTEWCSVGVGPSVGDPVYIPDCDLKVNVARNGGPITLADIENLPLCGQFGVVGPTPEARCTAIGSGTFGTRDDDYAHFSMVVSFVVSD